MFFTDIDREAGEATRATFLAEFGEARAEFSVQDVRDSTRWRQVWTQAETFFGGQVCDDINLSAGGPRLRESFLVPKMDILDCGRHQSLTLGTFGDHSVLTTLLVK